MRRGVLLALLTAFVSGCQTVQVTVCVVNAANNSLECSDPDGKASTLPLKSADNYVCFSPKDTERLLRACKNTDQTP